jgi:hypothetical protein
MDRLVLAAAKDLESKIHSPTGRYEIGQTMLEPFKEGRDYTSIGRKLLAVHHVEPGAPMWYDIDPQFSATVIGTLGAAPRVLDGSQFDRVELTPFPIVVMVRIPVIEPAVRRFDVLDREQVRAQAEMAELEDTEIFRAIRTGAVSGSGVSDGVSTPTNVTDTFDWDSLATAFANLEDACDSNVENMVMRTKDYKYVRSLLSSNPNGFDPVSRRELIKTGYMGDLYNAQVRVSKKQTTSEALLTASPEYVGVMSVRIDLSQMDAPAPELLQYGWLLYEFVAPAVLTNVGCNLFTITG